MAYALIALISNESPINLMVGSTPGKAVYAAKSKVFPKGSDKSKPGSSNKPSSSKGKASSDKKSKGGGLEKFSEPYNKKDKSKSETKSKDKKDKDSKHDSSDKDRDDYDDDNRRDGRRPYTLYLKHFHRYEDDDVFIIDNGFRYSNYPYHICEPAGSVYVHLMPENVRDVTYADTPAFQFRAFYQKVKKDISATGMYGKILTASGFTIDASGQFYAESVNGQA